MAHDYVKLSADSMFAPRFVTEFDLDRPDAEFAPPDGYRRALVLVKRGSLPLGLVPVEFDSRSPTASLLQAVGAHLVADEDHVEERRKQQQAAEAEGPHISVVLCTKDREEQLGKCLAALCQQEYERFEVIVVDNTRGSDAASELVAKLDCRVEVRLVLEPEGGLARARNRGVAHSKGSVVAFIDDDATPDPYWLTELAAGYVVTPEAAAVNGSIIPSEIETQAQEWFLQYGGHSKGRGFRGQIVDPGQRGSQSPLYPLPPFGAGGNMSVRRDALIGIGGFDEALGAGTPARGAEETAVFTRLLLAGQTVVYRPTAVAWHADRAELSALQGQMLALGTSLTAYYTSMLLRAPTLIVELLALLPRGIRDLRGGRGSLRTATMSEEFPRELLRVNRRGMLYGPFAYIRGLWAARGRCRAIR